MLLVIGVMGALVIGAMVLTPPKYGSYQECMAAFEVEFRQAERDCPGCNSYTDLYEYNSKKCSRY